MPEQYSTQDQFTMVTRFPGATVSHGCSVKFGAVEVKAEAYKMSPCSGGFHRPSDTISPLEQCRPQ